MAEKDANFYWTNYGDSKCEIRMLLVEGSVILWYAHL